MLLIALVSMTACGEGSGEGLDENGNPIPGEGGSPGSSICPGGALDASWGCIQAFVFTPKCAVCHFGPSAPKALKLDEANSPDIVDKLSVEMPSLFVIAPFDPATSYLVWKIEGEGPNLEPIIGDRMPAFSPALDLATIDTIKSWVSAGAQVP